MGSLYAKVKNRKTKEKIRKILITDQSIYPSVSEMVQEQVPYDDETILNENTWYSIPDFSKTPYYLPFLNIDMRSMDYSSLTREDSIDYIFYLSSDKNEFYFQNTGKYAFIEQKRIILSSDCFTYSPDSKSIVIKEYPDAIYIKDVDTLLFKRISSITSIFQNISDLYREATEEETKLFLNLDFIISENLKAEEVNIPNRKRIAQVMASLESLKPSVIARVYAYVNGYCPGVCTGNNKFKVTCNDDLTMVLYGIEQRFYTTTISNEKRIANSIIKMS